MNKRKNRRFFTKRQREYLFIASQGKCSLCHIDLDWSFHADHIIPYSFGGKTQTSNGQALCSNCNLKKGSKVQQSIKDSINNFKPREWQTHAAEAAKTELALYKSTLIVANPGAGKTWLAGYIAGEGIVLGAFDRIVVVSPTSALKSQWQEELWEHFSISLELDRPRESAGGDFHGVSVTYQGLASGPENFRSGCEQIGKTLVILDEPHHAGEDKSWGEAIEIAFGVEDTKILLLTGTPWRTDGTSIPYAPYDQNGGLKPAYNYGFEQAIRDRVNRAPRFFTFDADQVSWYDLDTGEHHEKSTLELVDENDSNKAYRAALDDPDTLEKMFTAADRQLTSLRNNEDINAGGLLIAKDLKSAEGARSMIEALTGITPRIVHNDVPNPNLVIDEFKNSLDRWIVAVEMISEGIDIKRLRCCVYAHRAKTELFFRQVVGRFTRRYSIDDQIEDNFGYMYMLQNRLLMKLAEKIEKETYVALKEIKEKESGTGNGVGVRFKGIIGTGVDLIDGDGVAGGRRIERQALAYVRKIIDNDPLLIGMDLMQAVHFLELTGRFEPELARKAKKEAEREKKEQSPEAYKTKMRKQYSSLIKRYVNEKYGKDAPAYYSKVYGEFNGAAGFLNVDDASIEQLETAIELIKQALGTL